MSWVEENLKTRERGTVVDALKIQKLEETKTECLAPMLKEADAGMKPFNPIRFQPVQSIGLFEAEFGQKNGDIIFHFWPYGHHEAVEKGNARPAFKATFLRSMEKAFEQVYDPHRLELTHEVEMNSYTVKAKGYAEQQFWKKNAIEVCTQTHLLMGGE